ncbi:MAG: hypothetical protein ACRD3J_24765, partial [Thermoanaerobaculia bacterium]
MNNLIRKYDAALVALLAIAASMTGIRNGFAYDDVRAIAEDQRLHQFRNLWHAFAETYWVPKYSGMMFRPLTSLGFGLEWLVSGGSPMLFHVVSITLYVAVCVAVLSLAKQLFDQTTAFAGAALFAVHPLHVEAVANVVGQAELGAALLVVLSVTQYLRWTRAGGIGPRRILALCVMYLCALMFKEHAVVLPGLIVAAELLVAAPQGFAQRSRRVLPLMVSMLAVAVFFILWRAAVIGTVTGTYEVNGLAGQSLKVRTFTMLPVILEWIRLFVWPASLSADYSSPRIDVMTSFNAMMIPAVAVIVSSALIVIRSFNDHPRTVFA